MYYFCLLELCTVELLYGYFPPTLYFFKAGKLGDSCFEGIFYERHIECAMRLNNTNIYQRKLSPV